MPYFIAYVVQKNLLIIIISYEVNKKFSEINLMQIQNEPQFYMYVIGS